MRVRDVTRYATFEYLPGTTANLALTDIRAQRPERDRTVAAAKGSHQRLSAGQPKHRRRRSSAHRMSRKALTAAIIVIAVTVSLATTGAISATAH